VALFVLAVATKRAVRAVVDSAIRAHVMQIYRDLAARENTLSEHTAALRILQEHDEQNTVRFTALSKAVDDAAETAADAGLDVRSAVADAQNTNNAMQELITEVREQARERGRNMFPNALPEVNVGAFGTSPLERPASIHRVPNPVPVAIDETATLQEDQELAAIARMDGPQKHLRLLVQVAKKECGPVACCKCVYWDQDEGQSSIQQLPVFASAARYVLPNRMGTAVLVDDNGDKLPDDQQPPPMLPAKLNKWELFGACGEDNAVHHAIDKCASFKPLARTYAGQEARA